MGCKHTRTGSWNYWLTSMTVLLLVHYNGTNAFFLQSLLPTTTPSDANSNESSATTENPGNEPTIQTNNKDTNFDLPLSPSYVAGDIDQHLSESTTQVLRHVKDVVTEAQNRTESVDAINVVEDATNDRVSRAQHQELSFGFGNVGLSTGKEVQRESDLQVESAIGHSTTTEEAMKLSAQESDSEHQSGKTLSVDAVTTTTLASVNIENDDVREGSGSGEEIVTDHKTDKSIRIISDAENELVDPSESVKNDENFAVLKAGEEEIFDIPEEMEFSSDLGDSTAQEVLLSENEVEHEEESDVKKARALQIPNVEGTSEKPKLKILIPPEGLVQRLRNPNRQMRTLVAKGLEVDENEVADEIAEGPLESKSESQEEKATDGEAEMVTESEQAKPESQEITTESVHENEIEDDDNFQGEIVEVAELPSPNEPSEESEINQNTEALKPYPSEEIENEVQESALEKSSDANQKDSVMDNELPSVTSVNATDALLAVVTPSTGDGHHIVYKKPGVGEDLEDLEKPTQSLEEKATNATESPKKAEQVEVEEKSGETSIAVEPSVHTTIPAQLEAEVTLTTTTLTSIKVETSPSEVYPEIEASTESQAATTSSGIDVPPIVAVQTNSTKSHLPSNAIEKAAPAPETQPRLIDSTPPLIDVVAEVSTEISLHTSSVHGPSETADPITDEARSSVATRAVDESPVSAGLGKALPTRSVGDEKSSSANQTTAVVIACTATGVIFLVLCGMIFLMTYRQRHTGTLDIELQEQHCGKDEDEDTESEPTHSLLEQVSSAPSQTDSDDDKTSSSLL